MIKNQRFNKVNINFTIDLSPESHSPDLLSTTTSTDSKKELMDMNFGIGFGLEFLSVAAGVTAKDKRIKEAKNQAALKKRKDFYSMISKLLLL